jgi:hypothetical protein
MRSIVSAALASVLAIAAVPAVAQDSAAASTGVKLLPGKAVYDAGGRLIGRINRLNAQGDAQIIVDGRLVTVVASTISDNGGKLSTTSSRRDLTSPR